MVKFSLLQDGDVIELCQVSDVRSGGVPKVIKSISLASPLFADSLMMGSRPSTLFWHKAFFNGN